MRREYFVAAVAFVIIAVGAVIPTLIDRGPYEEALFHYRAGRYTATLALLEKRETQSAGELDLIAWAHLQSGNVGAARETFARAISTEPKIAGGHCGMGYAHLRGGDPEDADQSFDAGLVLAPENVECLTGKARARRALGDHEGALEYAMKALALDDANAASARRARFLPSQPVHETALGISAALTTYRRNDFEAALPMLALLTRELPEHGDLLLALADTHYKLGDNLSAARTYRSMIDRNIAVPTAKERFASLYGVAEYSAKIPIQPTLRPRAARKVEFRAAGDYLEHFDGAQWRKTYLQGVNIGPARPGEFASTVSRDIGQYLEWLEQIAAMNANMVRIYTILPPAFYHALKTHNERAATPIWLFQEIWLDETEERNLYEPHWSREFRKEIGYVIDLIHGRANVPYRRGHASGIYTADVSRWTFAIGPGREVEPTVVQVTSAMNPKKTSFNGRYIKVASGNAAEVWFAEMLDYTAAYQMDRYGTQRPLTIINWPPLDPMFHVTEATYREELAIRKGMGEDVQQKIPAFMDDADVAVLDIMKLSATAAFPAGLFAAYHVYTYWPDFLPYDYDYPKVLDPRDGKSNRYYGYLVDLKKHHEGMPLLIAEYGVPTSWGVSHIHPDGWHIGGFNESEQAALLTKMSRNIFDARGAGAIVFAWKDEWWKSVSDVNTSLFDQPTHRRPYWLNMLNPEELFGILGYRAKDTVPLLRGNPDDWKKAKLLSRTDRNELQPGDLRRIYAHSDVAYLYLRLDIEKRPGQKAIDWSQRQYWIALNTLPGGAGTRQIPTIELESGANFLIRLNSPTDANLMIASSYNPTQTVFEHRFPFKHTFPGGKRSMVRQNMKVRLEERAPFEEMVVEVNRPRYGRDGTIFPPLFYNRSPLIFGTADPAAARFDSKAAWYVDEAGGMIELRIPWGYMYVTDPSDLNVMTGTDAKGVATWIRTPGIAVVGMAVSPAGADSVPTLMNTLPASTNGRIAARDVPRYLWEKWEDPEYESYLKQSYGVLRDVFSELDGEFQRKVVSSEGN